MLEAKGCFGPNPCHPSNSDDRRRSYPGLRPRLHPAPRTRPDRYVIIFRPCPNIPWNSRASVSGSAQPRSFRLLSVTDQIKNRTSPEVRLSDRNGHATFCADVFYMKIKKIVKPLQARSYVIRPACFLFEKSLELPCLSQIAGTCDGTNCQHGTVKNQHGDQEVRVPHA